MLIRDNSVTAPPTINWVKVMGAPILSGMAPIKIIKAAPTNASVARFMRSQGYLPMATPMRVATMMIEAIMTVSDNQTCPLN